MNTTTKRLALLDYTSEDHGIDHSQYFQGWSKGDYQYGATGAGETFNDAIDDALEQIASSADGDISAAIERVRDNVVHTEYYNAMYSVEEHLIREGIIDYPDDCELHYYASVAFNVLPFDKTTTELESEGYQGTDACLIVSLLENGLAWKETEDEIKFLYGVSIKGNTPDYYGFDHYNYPKDTDLRKEWDWVDWDAVANSHGIGVEDLLEAGLPWVVSALVSNYGAQEIFGEFYYGPLLLVIEG